MRKCRISILSPRCNFYTWYFALDLGTSNVDIIGVELCRQLSTKHLKFADMSTMKTLVDTSPSNNESVECGAS